MAGGKRLKIVYEGETVASISYNIVTIHAYKTIRGSLDDLASVAASMICKPKLTIKPGVYRIYLVLYRTVSGKLLHIELESHNSSYVAEVAYTADGPEFRYGNIDTTTVCNILDAMTQSVVEVFL